MKAIFSLILITKFVGLKLQKPIYHRHLSSSHSGHTLLVPIGFPNLLKHEKKNSIRGSLIDFQKVKSELAQNFDHFV